MNREEADYESLDESFAPDPTEPKTPLEKFLQDPIQSLSPPHVFCATPKTTVAEAVKKMNEEKIGAVVVTDGGFGDIHQFQPHSGLHLGQGSHENSRIRDSLPGCPPPLSMHPDAPETGYRGQECAMTPRSRPTRAKASTARSMSSDVWAALICVRMRARPFGTTG